LKLNKQGEGWGKGEIVAVLKQAAINHKFCALVLFARGVNNLILSPEITLK